jgi:hypothetical protein
VTAWINHNRMNALFRRTAAIESDGTSRLETDAVALTDWSWR